jgi:hypothetical protein
MHSLRVSYHESSETRVLGGSHEARSGPGDWNTRLDSQSRSRCTPSRAIESAAPQRPPYYIYIYSAASMGNSDYVLSARIHTVFPRHIGSGGRAWIGSQRGAVDLYGISTQYPPWSDFLISVQSEESAGLGLFEVSHEKIFIAWWGCP